MASPVVQMRFPPELLARIDEARGSQSRSAFIRSAVEMLLARGVEVGTVGYESVVRVVDDPSVPPGAIVVADVRTCPRGCVVPAAVKMKRCIPHGLELT